MTIKLFYHSLVSDWNHGNAHFLRGIAGELLAGKHRVDVFEPMDGWSLSNLSRDHGKKPLEEFNAYYPLLTTTFYNPQNFDTDSLLEGADLVIVHEWNKPELVQAIGKAKKIHGYRLLFHDTHHRSLTNAGAMSKYDLSEYDGVLAFGDVIRRIYLKNNWVRRAWTWHEAADVKLFRPLPKPAQPEGDLVWIGNWGDGERKEELEEFLIAPVRELKLKAKIYGVRYPPEALEALRKAGIAYGGYLPNYKVPEVFSRYRVTVHVPRRPYVKALPGIPTIRPFEALACGIPMVSAPWDDVENLFRPGKDFLFARNKSEMKACLNAVLNDHKLRDTLVKNGLETISSRHTCAHRVEELMAICEKLDLRTSGGLLSTAAAPGNIQKIK